MDYMSVPTLDEAYRHCEELARRHYENFTVGSALLPRGVKRHLWAMYAFARTTDDLGDEPLDSAAYREAVGGLPRGSGEADRLAALEAWEADLRLCRGGSPGHPVLVAAADTIREFDIPEEPFLRLIEANRLDQARTRHETWDDLLFYCERSANPCGRLVLYLFGVRDEEAFRLSDATCTALQLTNFWQDVAIDWTKGRVYLPQEDLRRFAVTEDGISAGRVDDAWRALMAFEVGRTRALFREGQRLVERLSGRAKFDVRLFSRGGLRILDLIERNGYDVFRRRPTISKAGKMWLALTSALGVDG